METMTTIYSVFIVYVHSTVWCSCIDPCLLHVGLVLRDTADELGSGDTPDSFVEEGTVPFG